eukprot:759038-Amorphochlora_amoeboformis.AAC.1
MYLKTLGTDIEHESRDCPPRLRGDAYRRDFGDRENHWQILGRCECEGGWPTRCCHPTVGNFVMNK